MIANQEINTIIEDREIVAGTETPSIDVTKKVEKSTERVHKEEDKRQRGNKMIFLDSKKMKIWKQRSELLKTELY